MNEFEKLTSRDNDRLKFARKVRDGKIRDSIFIEGSRLGEEVVRSGIVIELGFVTRKFIESERHAELLAQIVANGAEIFEISDKLLGSIADTEHPQGLVLICRRPGSGKHLIESAIQSADLPLVLFLNEINNPSNLGSIFRTAEAAGVAGIIISTRSSDPLSPKALRAAMGSSLRLPFWEQVSYAEMLAWAAHRKLITTATAAHGETIHTALDWKVPRLLIFGSEGHGLSEENLNDVEDTVKIPLNHNVESLNLAAACAVLLFEARRQVKLN